MATTPSLQSIFLLDITTSNSSLEDSWSLTPVKSISWIFFVGFIYGVIILLTTVGNAFVIAAYVVDIKIRSRASNMLIVNLAISDFGIGITLVFNFVFLVYDAWPLGEIPCKLWIVLDYTCSYMSVISIMLISLDRYWMVKKKLEYRSFQTKRRVLITVVICWIAVFTFYTITAFGYGAFTSTNYVDFSNDCEMEYLYSVPFSTVMIFVEFIIPFIVIVYLNMVVYSNVRMRSNGLVRSKPNKGLNVISKSLENLEKYEGRDASDEWVYVSNLGDSPSNIPVVTLSYPSTCKELGPSADINGSDHKDTSDAPNSVIDTTPRYDNSKSETEVDDGKISFESEQENGYMNAGFKIPNETESCNDSNNENQTPTRKLNSPLSARASAEDNASVNAMRTNKTQLNTANYLSASVMTLISVSVSFDGGTMARSKDKLKKMFHEFRRQRRAAILLFVLVIAFAICWLPYQITTIIMTVVGDEAVPELIAEIVTNLLWFNSTINPFLYAVIAASYRRNFLKFLGLANVSWLQKKGGKSSSDPPEQNHRNDHIASDS